MLPSSQTARVVAGVKTEVLLQAFADRILVLVTQLGKVGNLIQVSIPSTSTLLPPPPPDPSEPNIIPLPVPPASIQLTPLLGSTPSEHIQTLYSLYASQIATIIWTTDVTGMLEGEKREIVVGLALRKQDELDTAASSSRERELFMEVMGMVRELLQRK